MKISSTWFGMWDLLLKIGGFSFHNILYLSMENQKEKIRDEMREILQNSLNKIPKATLPLNYLTKRKISLKTIKLFRQKPCENEYIVPLMSYNFSTNLFKNITTITYKISNLGERSKNLLPVPKDGAISIFSTPKNTKNDVYIFESPVDALAFYELNKKQGVYVATCGFTTYETLHNLEILLKKLTKKYNKKQRVYICFDNDLYGNDLGQTIKEDVSRMGTFCEILKPKSKDFADDLINFSEEKSKNE